MLCGLPSLCSELEEGRVGQGCKEWMAQLFGELILKFFPLAIPLFSLAYS